MFRIEVQDLLEHRDRPRVEAVLLVLSSNLAVLRDRVFGLTPTAVGVADFEKQLRVTRVRCQESVVLLQSLGFGALLGVLARRVQNFSFIERQ